MWQDVMAVVAPIVICALVGAGWKYRKLPYPSDFIGSFVMNVAGPCLVLNGLTSTSIHMSDLLSIAGIGVLLMVGMIVTAALVLRVAGLSNATYLPVFLFPNTGNMGLPVCLFAFGEPGLALAISYFLFMMLAHFTLGMMIVQGGRLTFGQSLLNLLKQPMIYAMIIGLVVAVSGWEVPAWIKNTTRLIGDATIPLMLATLGTSLVSLKVHRWRRAVWLSVARQVLMLVVAYLVCELMGLQGLVRDVVLIQAVMPAAVYNYLFALRFSQAPDDVAGVVVLSTLLSLILLPVFVALLL